MIRNTSRPFCIRVYLARAVVISCITSPCLDKPLVNFDVEKYQSCKWYDAKQNGSRNVGVKFDVYWIVPAITN